VGTTPTDSGQTDYGPPLVTLRWPGLYDSSDYPASSPNVSCKADVPVLFEIQNRGNSIPKMNVNRWAERYPKTGTSNDASKWLTTLTNPTFDALTNSVRSTLTIQSGPTGNLGAYKDNIFFDDFQVAADRSGDFSSSTGVISTSNTTRLTSFIGPYKQDETLTLMVANVPGGPYLLFYDLYLLEDWQGANPVTPAGTTVNPHSFTVRITAPTTQTLFDKSLSSSSSYGQSYTGPATFKDVLAYPAIGDALKDAAFPIATRLNLVCPTFSGNGPCSLQVTFAGKNLTSATTQFWGIDNVGILPLREMAVKYTFTDTNQLTSAYCMWFEVYNTCKNPGTANPAGGNTCSCWAGAKKSLASGETFTATRSDAAVECPVSAFPDSDNYPLPAPIIRVLTP